MSDNNLTTKRGNSKIKGKKQKLLSVSVKFCQNILSIISNQNVKNKAIQQNVFEVLIYR